MLLPCNSYAFRWWKLSFRAWMLSFRMWKLSICNFLLRNLPSTLSILRFFPALFEVTFCKELCSFDDTLTVVFITKRKKIKD